MERRGRFCLCFFSFLRVVSTRTRNLGQLLGEPDGRRGEERVKERRVREGGVLNRYDVILRQRPGSY